MQKLMHAKLDVGPLAVTIYKAPDGAYLVEVDTTFEPNASDGGPGLRVYINDDLTYEGRKVQ